MCDFDKIEVWKDIAGYEGLYQVSNHGRVRSLDKEVWNGHNYFIMGSSLLKQRVSSNSYMICDLYKDGNKATKTVHRLVAEAFISNPDSLPEINHKDMNKVNNHVSNIEWCTHKYNIKHSFHNRSGTWLGKFGKDHPNSIPVQQYNIQGELLAEYDGLNDASRITGVRVSGISQACNGILKTSGGFKWKFKEQVL